MKKNIVSEEKQVDLFQVGNLRRRFGVLLSVFGIWSLLAIFFAYPAGSIAEDHYAIFELWTSTLAGPFAFVGQTLFMQHPIIAIVTALFLLALIISDPIFGQVGSAILTTIGVSLWFMFGFVISYIGI